MSEEIHSIDIVGARIDILYKDPHSANGLATHTWKELDPTMACKIKPIEFRRRVEIALSGGFSIPNFRYGEFSEVFIPPHMILQAVMTIYTKTAQMENDE